MEQTVESHLCEICSLKFDNELLRNFHVKLAHENIKIEKQENASDEIKEQEFKVEVNEEFEIPDLDWQRRNQASKQTLDGYNVIKNPIKFTEELSPNVGFFVEKSCQMSSCPFV